MLVLNEGIKRRESVMQKITDERNDRTKKEMEDSRLSHELKHMNRRGDAVRRGANMGRIGEYNRSYVKKLTRLAIIRQTTGTMDRDEAVDEVKKWKANL